MPVSEQFGVAFTFHSINKQLLYIYSYLFTLGLPVAPRQSENVVDESNLAVDDQSNTVTNVAATRPTVRD